MQLRSKIYWGILFLLTAVITYTSIIATPVSGERKKIGATYMTMNNSFYKAINSEIKKYVSEREDTLVVRDPELDASKQVEQIKEMIDDKVNVIIINPVEANNKKIIDVLKQAKHKGIYIVVVDTQLTDSSFVDCTILSDNYNAGVICAKDLMKRKKKADILLLEHSQALSAVDRINGFKDTIKKHTSYHIVTSVDTLGQTEFTMPKVESLISRGYHFDTVMALNDPTALGALAALEEKNIIDSTLVYGVDGSPNMKKFILDKNAAVLTAAQSPESMASTAITNAYSLLNEHKVEKKVVLKINNLISKENIDEYNVSGWQ